MRLSFRTPQRGDALVDAPRRRTVPRRTFRNGRRASRKAYPRGAWARWCCCSLVPHVPTQGAYGNSRLCWVLA
ncbi:DUF1534 domain-containing protein [Pseudomonas sp. ST1]|uniref:DUF1534 domain-containing protein n=1 Tax=Pseudomonas savastanoi pv. nerii TaxID=360921 RepID=A0AB73QC24_PSESS|nr:DUF1534 domain-containing protein [Pseudomonas savastanoi]PAB37042.1 hypothetical protein CC202_02295 [Pseudomonas savastanoi]PAB37224.1 hypothetical protein CCZ00_03770 [Pseudomonas savastanoi pv. fraxini]PAB39458.1 hypothetical protein CC205_01330 [Pseudomonas savastanoi pv. nerii]TSC37619.1 DUF1534 domain-containing protein [Pseudomonas sp. ST1]